MEKKVFIFNLFVNSLMRSGKSISARNTFLNALNIIKKETDVDPYYIALRAIENVKPMFELKTIKIAASRYKLPYLLKSGRDYIYAAKFILKSAHKRSERNREHRLAAELIAASRGKGTAIKLKKNLYDDVVFNRAYLRFLKK